jgi:hypothetical protein
MRCEFRLEDGSLNLDLTSKILRKSLSNIRTYKDTGNGYYQDYENPFSSSKIRFYEDFTDSLGGPNSDTGLTFMHDHPEDIIIFSSKNDSDIIIEGGNTSLNSNKDGVVNYHLLNENWADNSNTKYKDYFVVRDSSGNLLWSTGTLGDAIFRSGQIWVDSLNKIYTFTSPNDRRLYILRNELFLGGTYVDDGSNSLYSNSGIMARWSNNGRKIEIAYVSYDDNDIVNYFDKVKKAPITLFEMYDS